MRHVLRIITLRLIRFDLLFDALSKASSCSLYRRTSFFVYPPLLIGAVRRRYLLYSKKTPSLGQTLFRPPSMLLLMTRIVLAYESIINFLILHHIPLSRWLPVTPTKGYC